MKPAAEVRRDLAAIDTRPRRCHVCNAWLPDGPCEHFPEQWLPTPAALRAFLREHYKRDRFEGRDDDTWGLDYSGCVTRSHLDDLRRLGFTCISRHESASGAAVWYDAGLRIMTDDEARERLRASARRRNA